jgi:hypothetical protein
MKRIHPMLRTGARVLALAALPLALGQAQAATQLLRADTVTMSMPGTPDPVVMWGYAADNAACGSAGVTVPGPPIVVPAGDPALTVTLKNCLDAPTSLIIHGQQVSDPAPVWTDGTSGARGGDLTKRVRSFTHETLAGGGIADYVWSNLKPGTYLYGSGTHPQVQVQMGLYGSLIQDTDAGNVAYRQGATDIIYANQLILLYSEIDPVLHAAVANGSYGTIPTSTLEYHPKFFLINGQPYDATSNPGPVATVPAAQSTLLRFLNASLKTHVPTIDGQYWKMIAEDGNPYPYANNPRQQYTAFLAPGKTMDVMLVPTASGRYAIYDSREFDTNNGVQQGGGMLAFLDVGAAGAAAPVFDSAPVTSGTAGVPYSYVAHASDPNGDPVAYSFTPVPPATAPNPPAGMTIDAGTGAISWTPAAAGSYPVSVRASDGTLFSDQAFSIAVAPAVAANTPPTARADVYTAVSHPAASLLVESVAAPGVLGNDTDPDGNALSAVALAGGSNAGRVTLNADGSFALAPAGGGANGSTATVVVNYQANDGAGGTSNSTLTINFVTNRRPTAFADAFTVPRCTTASCAGTSLNLVNNDTDPDTATIDVANQLPLAVARVRRGTGGSGSTTGITTNSKGTVTVSGGTVTYTPRRNFAGTDSFWYRVKDKIGLESGDNNAGGPEGWVSVTVTVQ